uniref:ATP synthase complex subunit 8 n=1 Tax=Helarctos malayanus TaxID=9634 RepID=A8QW97_HELMA|nr:ATP synthase F0 subunit 8 [Helarctos malayanus]ABM63269.1 ATP synthase F0 subunit 8 [Helarctos malayanus]UML39790.1 ATP synthase F0 subunit 8 [Helarctos malayanus]WFF50929.1 ATP synthase F0 subunit 8 [Helarctos malayanus]WFF50942.1 ATP synthase F0 subunit 8 [Helarctos malayanus]WFF50981.1 ATP synthase F0 subunit 8 [Helarctos malayanus]
MPQLDTSTWSVTILSMVLALFIVFQLKVSKYKYPETPTPKSFSLSKKLMPWEEKWTKICSPLLLPQR